MPAPGLLDRKTRFSRMVQLVGSCDGCVQHVHSRREGRGSQRIRWVEIQRDEE